MVNQSDIEQEALLFVQESIEKEGRCPVTWATHGILNSHPEIDGVDADWYRVCGYVAIRAAVTRAIRRFEPKEKADAQITMPGFDYVQKAYNVTRDDEQIAVRTDLLTPAELRMKLQDLRATATGYTQHADELERYILRRESQERAVNR